MCVRGRPLPTRPDAENPYLSEDARRVLAEETEEARLVVEEENGSDEESDAPPYPPMPPGANETHHHSWQSVNLHTHHHRHPPPPSVPPLHSPPHNPNAPGAYDPCVGKGTPKATVSCFPRPPSPPPSPGPPPYPPMLPLASVPPFSPQDLGGILSGSLTNERCEPQVVCCVSHALFHPFIPPPPAETPRRPVKAPTAPCECTMYRCGCEMRDSCQPTNKQNTAAAVRSEEGSAQPGPSTPKAQLVPLWRTRPDAKWRIRVANYDEHWADARTGAERVRSKEGYELMAAMFAFGGVGVVMGVMHWSKQQRSHALKYSALQDTGVPQSDVRVAGYGALSDNAAPHLPPAQNDDIWGRASYQEPDQAL
jgi:hypothetical protein